MRCERSEWLGEPIPLELHHLNGERTDHRIDNLQLLCPNCHALTDTYRAKNKQKPAKGEFRPKPLYNSVIVSTDPSDAG